MEKLDIKSLTLEELREKLVSLGEPGYRAGQIFFWIYRKGKNSFREMPNLPATLQDRLGETFFLSEPSVSGILRAADGVEKFLFRLTDQKAVETVFIPTEKRNTVCVSTQVGCRFYCTFCASGLHGFKRNLAVSEIVDQVLFLKFKQGYPVHNIVFMGMGEPFDNYENLVKAIRIINCAEGLQIGARKITVSTCGIVPAIRQFQNLGLQVELSISLHAANEQLRSKLMPVNRKYPLRDLLAACQKYTAATRRRITLEYVLAKGVNDSFQDAGELARLARILNAKVNLIPYSPVPGKSYQPPLRKDIFRFADSLEKQGVNVTVRRSRGKDIRAACGQLAGASQFPPPRWQVPP